MSDNPRDTQFAGYAKLLFEDLKPDLTVLFLALGNKDARDIEWAENFVQATIAQRAYNLTCHIVRYINERDLAMVRSGMWSEEDCVARIPDLTKWTNEGKINNAQ